MKAKADPEFWRRYNELPARVQELARKSYALWLANPFHPSLQFKQISKTQWSARVGLHYRATGYFLTPEIFVWDWIGTHEEYNKF
ncbi:MAG TPA: hypothetical protein VN784_05775 [Candidatus Limnocylindrales bacterium]|nr:hypothetical protein [Candidatus Limnocylindrales bacterium]